MLQAHDWKRPIAWGIAAFIFFSIMTMTPTIPFDHYLDILLASLLFGAVYSIGMALVGVFRTILSLKPTRILIPFYTASTARSLQAIGLWALGMAIKVALFNLATIGVIVMLFVAFAALQRLWPEQSAETNQR